MKHFVLRETFLTSSSNYSIRLMSPPIVCSAPNREINEITVLTEETLLWKPARIDNEIAPVLATVGTMSTAFFVVLARISAVSPA
jgi:hypothetical protein